jgi:hypothetical protein
LLLAFASAPVFAKDALPAGLQKGMIDCNLFSADVNGYFDATALHDYRTSLAPLGKPRSFKIHAARKRGGMQMRGYSVTFPKTKLSITTYTLPGGKLEQYIVSSGDRPSLNPSPAGEAAAGRARSAGVRVRCLRMVFGFIRHSGAARVVCGQNPESSSCSWIEKKLDSGFHRWRSQRWPRNDKMMQVWSMHSVQD